MSGILWVPIVFVIVQLVLAFIIFSKRNRIKQTIDPIDDRVKEFNNNGRTQK